MNNTMSRRDALKLGTNAAVSAAITPLLAGESVDASLVKGSVEAGATPPTIPSLAKTPESAPDICFMRAVDMARLIREKKLSAREVMQAHLKQIGGLNSNVNAIVTLVAEEQSPSRPFNDPPRELSDCGTAS